MDVDDEDDGQQIAIFYRILSWNYVAHMEILSSCANNGWLCNIWPTDSIMWVGGKIC